MGVVVFWEFYPSIFFRLLGVKLWWQQVSVPNLLLPGNVFHLFLPEAVPRPDKICNPSREFWVYPRVSFQVEVPRTPPKGGLNPRQLAPFYAKEQRLDSKLPMAVRAPLPISKDESSHPTEETYFNHLHPQSHSLSHYPKVMTIDERVGVFAFCLSFPFTTTVQWNGQITLIDTMRKGLLTVLII